MTNRHYPSMRLLLAASLLAAALLVTCKTSQESTQNQPASPQATGPVAKTTYVVFEGPWAFAPDPKDAKSILAIAPKAKAHRELYVKASNLATLPVGVYDLALPPRTGTAAGTVDPSIVQAKSDAQSVQRALDNKLARYAIRLPKPDAFGVAARTRSRVSATYPPDASTEKDYAIAVSLQYDVSSLNGFSIAGTPDTGSFNPLLLQLDTPATVRFVIEPSMDDDPADKCDTHSRESFAALTKLIGLTLYVDFPGNPDSCHDTDPQKTRPAHADATGSLSVDRLASLLEGNSADIHSENAMGIAFPYASILSDAGGRAFVQRFLATFLFGRPSGNCKSPNIVLNT